MTSPVAAEAVTCGISCLGVTLVYRVFVPKNLNKSGLLLVLTVPVFSVQILNPETVSARP